MKKKLILLTCISLISVSLHAFKFKIYSMAPYDLTDVEIVYASGKTFSALSPLFKSAGGATIPKRKNATTPSETILTTNGQCVDGIQYIYHDEKQPRTYSFRGQLKPANYPLNPLANELADPCGGCVKLFISEQGIVSNMTLCD